jgi:hypothetical protein
MGLRLEKIFKEDLESFELPCYGTISIYFVIEDDYSDPPSELQRSGVRS